MVANNKDEEAGIPMLDNFDGGNREDAVDARPPPVTLRSRMPQSLADVVDNGPVSVVAYCVSSISMTVVNKYVVSGSSWNLTFLYLAIQVRRCPPTPHMRATNHPLPRPSSVSSQSPHARSLA